MLSIHSCDSKLLNSNPKWTLLLGQESNEDSVASSVAEKNIMELLQIKKNLCRI